VEGKHAGLAEVSTARKVFFASVVITGLLYAVPYGQYVAYPLLLLSTLVHELGHGLSAVLMGGSFEKFLMWPDGSGVAMHAGRYSGVQNAMVSAGGLVGPAIGAMVGMVCARRRGSSKIFLGALGVGLVLAELLVVRNVFGLFFVGALAAICIALAWKAPAEWAQIAVMFLSVQLGLSVFSRGDYLFTDVAMTSNGPMPSDVAHMASALGGPYWLWGGVCAVFSVAALALGAVMLLRNR